MTTTATADYEVTWPDGDLFANRFHETRFTYETAREIAAHIGGDIRPAKPEIRTCYCGTTATAVPGVFPHRDCDGSVPAHVRPAETKEN